MRLPLLLATVIVVTACGDDGETLDPAPGNGGSDRPECEGCYDTLVAETDLCGPQLDACLNDPNLPLEPIVQCFQRDGRCYDDALNRSAACNRSCGDDGQAMLEVCVGQCFLDRADCSEAVVREVDGCLDSCSGPGCDACTARGEQQFGECNTRLEACSVQCRSQRG